MKNKTIRKVKGVVLSTKASKTITVEVTRIVKHPLYGKYIRRKSKMHAHDEDNSCNVGDLVMIRESKPISKTKFWILDAVLRNKIKEVTT